MHVILLHLRLTTVAKYAYNTSKLRNDRQVIVSRRNSR